MQVRYQAALRPDEARDSNRGVPPRGSPSAQYFKDRSDFCTKPSNIQRRCGECWHRLRGCFRIVFQSLARAADGEAFFVQQFADASDQQDFMMLVVTPVATPLDRAQLGEFLFPVTQYMRLDGAQIGHFTDGEVTLRRNRRKFTPG